MTRSEIEAIVRAHAPLALPSQDLRAAAVLVPLIPRRKDAADLDVLLTRRASDMGGKHAGQVSFPGGRIEPEDGTAEVAALRETHEELGIAPEHIEVVGRMGDMVTVTGFHITPVVGVVAASAEITPSPREVARVFRVPLATLLDPQAWEQRAHRYGEATFRIWHLPFDGEDVWGATAEMLRAFVELLWGNR